jgi:hypothetical protein
VLPEDGEGNSVYLLELSREDFSKPPEDIPLATEIDDDRRHARIGFPSIK